MSKPVEFGLNSFADAARKAIVAAMMLPPSLMARSHNALVTDRALIDATVAEQKEVSEMTEISDVENQ